MTSNWSAITGAVALSIGTLGCSPGVQKTTEEAAANSGEAVEPVKPAVALPVDFFELPEGRSDEGWVADRHLELLCNPVGNRFILQTSPPQYRSVPEYPKRHVWDVDDLYVAVSDGFRREQGFADSRRSFAKCGDYVIVVEADKTNWNWRGREGANDPYFAARIVNDFRMVYPNEARYEGPDMVPLGGAFPMWNEMLGRDERGCPWRMVSAIDVRLDLENEATKINLIVRDPDEKFKRASGLELARDYSDCSRAVHGSQSTIVFTGPDYGKPGAEDAPWIF